MSRPAPTYETLAAIAQAFDERDRLMTRSVIPVLSGPARPLLPSEIISRLRSIAGEAARASQRQCDVLGLSLELVAIGCQANALADRIEGLRPVELEDAR